MLRAVGRESLPPTLLRVTFSVARPAAQSLKMPANQPLSAFSSKASRLRSRLLSQATPRRRLVGWVPRAHPTGPPHSWYRREIADLVRDEYLALSGGAR